MKGKADFFKNKKVDVHISLKSGRFYNGKILDTEGDFIIMVDKKLGEVPIFFNEIKEDGIEPFTEVGE